MEENKIYLDWKSQRLFGWEKTKRGIIIASILEGILHNDEFPAVSVLACKNKPNHFYLDAKKYLRQVSIGDGGHKLALGHFILGKPLKCDVKYVEVRPEKELLPIEYITISHHQEDLRYFNWLREEIGFYREVSKETYRNFRRKFPDGKKVISRMRKEE